MASVDLSTTESRYSKTLVQGLVSSDPNDPTCDVYVVINRFEDGFAGIVCVCHNSSDADMVIKSLNALSFEHKRQEHVLRMLFSVPVVDQTEKVYKNIQRWIYGSLVK